MLNKVKLALRITTTVYDTELSLLISAALQDLQLVGIKEYTEQTIPPIVQLAVITYCRLHFGQPEDFEKLEKSYAEQKAQLLMSTPYTNRTGW